MRFPRLSSDAKFPLKSALFFIAIAATPFAAIADPGDSVSAGMLHRLAMGVPEELIQNGIGSIGHVDLRAMLERFSAVQVFGCFYPFDKWEPAFQAPDATQKPRASGRYTAGAVYVYLGENLREKPISPEMALLMVHESLGATAYPDRNYSLSVAMNVLLREEDPVLRADYRAIFDRSFMDFDSLTPTGLWWRGGGGGGIGVGGGDLDGLLIKYALVARYDELAAAIPDPLGKRARARRAEWIRSVLTNTDVEADDALTVDFAVANSATVRVSRAAWQAADAAGRKALLEEILGAIVADLEAGR